VSEVYNYIKMNISISEVLRYYGMQGKRMTLKDIHRYIQKSSDIKNLAKSLRTAAQDKRCSFDEETKTYTEIWHEIPSAQYQARAHETSQKLASIDGFLRICQSVPTVTMIGLTGSCAISNATPDDDIDLMIVTSAHRLFITRLIVTGIAQIMGVRHKRGAKHDPDKVCLNLWLDESDLTVPSPKISLYSAREMAQIQTLFDRNNCYERFQTANPWVKTYLPNFTFTQLEKTNSIKKDKKNLLPTQLIGDLFEKLAKQFQLRRIKRHLTREHITGTQLWFHPIDRTRNEV
jgi:predicted nucleotidyltransferase